jgi:hypothetical protein
MKLLLNSDGTKTPEFTYREVSDEVTRLGLLYPADDRFSEEEVTEAIGKLDDYATSKKVVTFEGPDFTPAQLTAFAKFAEALGKDTKVTHDYNGWVIKREASDEEKRNAALANLKSEVSQNHRSAAEAELKRRFDAGDLPEIEITTERAYS